MKGLKVVYVPGPPRVDRDEALELAERWLKREAPNPRDVLVVVPILDSVGRSPVLIRLAGIYRVETERTLRSAARRVVLAVWPTTRTLAKINSARPRAVCVMQWTEEHTNDWLAAMSAEDLSGRAPALESATIADPIVRAALEGLTSDINLGNRLHQPEDHDLAVSTLQLLNRHDHGLDPDEIYRWSLAHEWPDDSAGNLKKLVQELLGGHRHRIRFRGPLGEDTYRHWRKKAAERADGGDDKPEE